MEEEQDVNDSQVSSYFWWQFSPSCCSRAAALHLELVLLLPPNNKRCRPVTKLPVIIYTFILSNNLNEALHL